MSDGGGGQEVTSDPWSGVQPYLYDLFGRARREIADYPREFYPESTVTPFAPETEASLDAMTGRAMRGSALNPMAQQQVAQTLGGEYLAGGEGFDAYADAVTSAVRPAIESQFASAGRSGSPLMAEALGRGVSRGMAPLYDAERSRMMAASSMAPQLAREDYYDIDRLGGVGARREDLYSRQLGDQIRRWDFAMNEPYGRLQQYGSLLQGGLPFGSQTSSQGGKGAGQTAMGGLGAAASIAGLGGPGGFGMWGA